MLQQKLPSQITYPTILPKGFPNVFKEWNLDPMSSNKQWVNNDIVRFNFMNLGKGVFDPYRSYIEFTVHVSQQQMPVGLLQIDSSAQSFIQQMVLYSNSKQIQRINQYGVLASYLNDIGVTQLISEGRQTQGLGYGSFDTMPLQRSPGSVSTCPRNCQSSTFSTTTVGFPTIFPTIGNYWGDCTGSLTNSSILNASKTAKGHITNANPIMTSSDINGGINDNNKTAMQASLYQLGYGNNIRAEYQSKYVQNKFPQHTQSIPNFELQLNDLVANQKYPFYFTQNNPYRTYVRSTWVGPLEYDTDNNSQTQAINSANFGFNSLFCPYFTRGTFQPIISATVPQCMIMNGQYLSTKVPIIRKKFKLPLLSSVIGALIDPSQFLLIPLQAINTCLLELTLDPYAMFTSGYCDVSEMDSVGISVQQRRCYIIDRIQYKLQTYHFVDQQIQKWLQTSLVKQISILGNFWMMSNQYQIPGGNLPNNTYIVGCNSTHLNQIVCLFVPNDYQVYSFARKHFRISNNVKKFWSKLAVDYWPPQPYKGNGGNVYSNNIDDDNSVFVENIYWSGNYMFSKSALPRINCFNFAVNERPYTINNKNTFYDPNMLNNQHYTFTSSSINADTGLGMSWIHENRVVGKAAYVINFTPFSQNDQILHGINVSQISNFQVIFQCDGSNAFPRDQTLFIFCRCSGVVKYGINEIKTYGRG